MDSKRKQGFEADLEEVEVRLRQQYITEDDDETLSPIAGGMFYSSVSSKTHSNQQQAPPTDDFFLSPAPLSEQETIDLGKEAIRSFLTSRTVYDSMPKSGRVVIFDVHINLKLVLYALLEHEIRGAPLWDPSVQRLVGMFTLSDFASIIRHCEAEGESVQELMETHTIASWRNLILNGGDEPGKRCASAISKEKKIGDSKWVLYSVQPTVTLYDACKALKDSHVHRLPVIDSDNQTCLHIITFQTILEYLTTQFSEERRLFDQPIYDLGVGSYAEPASSIYMGYSSSSEKRMVTATAESTLKEVAEKFAKNENIATIPILDSQGKVRDIYRHSFMANLNLDDISGAFKQTMRQVLESYERVSVDGLEQVHTCTPKSTLFQVFLLFAETKARTLVVVDDDEKFLGICSLSDVLCHFL